MAKKTNILIVISILLGYMDAQCQERILSSDTVRLTDFSNEFLLKGKKAKIYMFYSTDSLNRAVVRWNNGYFAVGKVREGNVVGKWFLYDKKNRLREYVVFGPFPDCIIYSKKLNKKGEIVSEIKARSLCF